MKWIIPFVAAAFLAVHTGAAASAESDVRSTIQKFVDAFNDGFVGPADYAAQDWNHVAPNGELTEGREATLKRVRELHQGFLKGARETVESMDVRFATNDVAIVTAVSVYTLLASPGGKGTSSQRGIRTFIVVNRGGRWLIVQDHNTPVSLPPR